MTKFMTILLALAIIMLPTGYAISEEENDEEIVKQRAEIIPFIDKNGVEMMRFVFIYGEDEKLTGLIIIDKYSNVINLKTGDSVGR